MPKSADSTRCGPVAGGCFGVHVYVHAKSMQYAQWVQRSLLDILDQGVEIISVSKFYPLSYHGALPRCRAAANGLGDDRRCSARPCLAVTVELDDAVDEPSSK